MFAGSLTRNPITAVFCLMLTLLLAGCSGSKSSDMGQPFSALWNKPFVPECSIMTSLVVLNHPHG
ncbi:hypothetical protein EGM92_13325 [Enterobacter cloacae]|nr:hypothetical protein EGM92_13325 [Enterobacter cloacae]